MGVVRTVRVVVLTVSTVVFLVAAVAAAVTGWAIAVRAVSGWTVAASLRTRTPYRLYIALWLWKKSLQ